MSEATAITEPAPPPSGLVTSLVTSGLLNASDPKSTAEIVVSTVKDMIALLTGLPLILFNQVCPETKKVPSLAAFA